MIIMEISIVPVGTGNPSVSRYVANALKALDKQKSIEFELTPMGTVLQSDSLDALLQAAREMHNAVLSDEVKRVVTSIKIDHRKDKDITMHGKIRSVAEKTDVKSGI